MKTPKHAPEIMAVKTGSLRVVHRRASIDEELLDRIADLAFEVAEILDLLEVSEVEPKLKAIEPEIRAIRQQVCRVMNALEESLGKA